MSESARRRANDRPKEQEAERARVAQSTGRPTAPREALVLQRSRGNASTARFLQEVHTRRGRAHLQRALDAETHHRFLEWFDEQQVGGRGKIQNQLEEISREADSLGEAMDRALRVAARSGVHDTITKRKKIDDAGTARGRAVDSVRVEARKELETILDALDGQSEEADLGEAIPRGAQSAVKALTGAFPPEKHRYVMLGNSVAPLMAWLENDPKTAGAVVHLPLGGLTAGRVHTANALQEPLAAHLEKYLQSVKGHPLVVVDFAVSGDSVKVVVDLLGRWLPQAGRVASFVFTKDEAAAIEGQFDYIHRPKSPHEKVFAELTSGKDLKNAMHLKGPEEADVKELLEEIDSGTDKGAVKDRREQYARLRRLLGAARQRMEQTDGL